MKIKQIKTIALVITISCAIISIWDFFLAFSKIQRGEYGMAIIFFLLGLFVAYCFKVNLKALISIKNYENRKVKRDNS